MAILVYERHDGARIQTKIGKEPLRIGRDPGCQLCLPSDDVSRVHATVRSEGVKTFLRDEGSYNGSSVNEERVSGERPLKDGDRINIAGHRILFLEKDPYGEDSLSFPTPVVARLTEELPATEPSTPATAPPIPGPTTQETRKPAMPASSSRGLLLALVSIGTLAVVVLAVGVVFMAFPRTGAGGWRDAAGIVAADLPPSFKPDELSAERCQWLGPRGKNWASTIAISVAPTSGATTPTAEIAKEEQTLAADARAEYRRIGAGDTAIQGTPAAFLIYQRLRGANVLVRNHLVITIADGHRVSIKLSAEPEVWDAVDAAFSSYLTRIRLLKVKPGGS